MVHQNFIYIFIRMRGLSLPCFNVFSDPWIEQTGSDCGHVREETSGAGAVDATDC